MTYEIAKTPSADRCPFPALSSTRSPSTSPARDEDLVFITPRGGVIRGSCGLFSDWPPQPDVLPLDFGGQHAS